MPVLVGSLASLCNIAIHAWVMTWVIRVAQTAAQKCPGGQSPLLVAVMASTISVLMAAHAVEVMVWAMTYFLVGAAPAGADLVYFAGVTFTTLGYGDVVPVTEWKLLGPMTAMNGVLLFGWSTAVIFEVLHKALQLTDRTAFRNPPSGGPLHANLQEKDQARVAQASTPRGIAQEEDRVPLRRSDKR